jgi:thiol-disulfide isomerase/thioredoxin
MAGATLGGRARYHAGVGWRSGVPPAAPPLGAVPQAVRRAPGRIRAAGTFCCAVTGLYVLAGAVVLTVVLARVHRSRDGRLRQRTTGEDLRPLLTASGEKATLLQFSSAFCAPCRATKRILGEIAAVVPGVAHVEVDAESNLELVRRLNILKTPTTLVLDASGREVLRASGQPKKADVLTALTQAVPS